MGRIRRGGYVFISWKGDHDPRHVHVFKDRKLVLKWDVESWVAIKGRPIRRLLGLLEALHKEKLL